MGNEGGQRGRGRGRCMRIDGYEGARIKQRKMERVKDGDMKNRSPETRKDEEE